MLSPNFGFFDETYFNHGNIKGTVYANYIHSARSSAIYRNIVEAIVTVFKPERALEVGCATGIMIKYLNAHGVEAHGVDVSEWAIEHREHENVIRASAHELPYPNDYFDLVFSVHALEHLPDEIYLNGLGEMTRVSSSYQFHMLPMIGVPPYMGTPAAVVQELRKDPSHAQIHPKDFWVKQITSCGNKYIHTTIPFSDDNERCELTNGQMLFRKALRDSTGDEDLYARISEWTRLSFARLKANEVGRVSGEFSIDPRGLEFTQRTWKDFERIFNRHVDFDKLKVINVVAILQGKECTMRIALVQDSTNFDNVLEKTFTVYPGLNQFRIPITEFVALRGTPDAKRISRLLFGGEGESAQIRAYIFDDEGRSIT